MHDFQIPAVPQLLLVSIFYLKGKAAEGGDIQILFPRLLFRRNS